MIYVDWLGVGMGYVFHVLNEYAVEVAYSMEPCCNAEMALRSSKAEIDNMIECMGGILER